MEIPLSVITNKNVENKKSILANCLTSELLKNPVIVFTVLVTRQCMTVNLLVLNLSEENGWLIL